MSHQDSRVRASLTKLSPDTVDIKDPQDNTPSDSQPPGVDEERTPQSLEEALLG